ncbi:hypothetical protein HDZ31DRAFT_68658 [Schizophyllum fasciatum]
MSSTHITTDPSLESCPDFAAEPWEAVRQGLISASRTEEQAIAVLQEGWERTHQARLVAWAEQTRLVQEAEEAAAAALAQEEARKKAEREAADRDKERGDAGKGKNKLSDFDEDALAPDSFIPLPSAYARSKLDNQEYVELYYFTNEGCQEAANQKTSADDAFGLSREDDQVTLRPASAVRASKNAIADENLTWTQMTIGKTGFLKAAVAAGWPEKHIAALTNFFWAIENHPILEREHGQAILLRFQAQTRRWWHEDLRHPNATKWNIGRINENAIETVARKYYAEKQDLALTKLEAITSGQPRRTGRAAVAGPGPHPRARL